jgi:segregation and condensation protein B
MEENRTDERISEEIKEETSEEVKEETNEEIIEETTEEIKEESTSLEGAIEAILFSVGDSVEIAKLSEALETDKKKIREILSKMQEKYESQERGIRIMLLEDAVQLCTKPEYYQQLIKVVQKQKTYTLTDTVLETLSIIAYKQPVTKAEMEKIRGVSCDHAVNRLLEFGLIRELGRLNAPGRPLLFGTTEEFLRIFGVSSTDNLPVLNTVQIEEFKKEAEEEIALSSETVEV